MFIAVSRFTIRNREMIEAVKEAFRNRPHRVDKAPGFVRMDVASPIDHPEEIILFTYWVDETSFRSWHRSRQFKESHRMVPKGLKVAPGSAALHYFHHVCS